MGLAHSPRIVTDGLVLCVDAASKRSYPGTGTTWTDLKGGNNGTLINGPTFDSDNGGSIVFDGSDDRVDCTSPSEIDSISEITMIAWVRYSGIAVTSGSVVKFYKNSDLVYTSGSITTNTGTGSTLVLGNRPGGGRNFSGRMGVAMVYNRVLSADEILQNYLSTKERYA